MATLPERLAAAEHLFRVGNARAAEASLAAIVNDEPSAGEAWYLRSQVALAAGQANEAEEYARRVVELMPKSAEALVGLAAVLSAAGRFEEAIDCCQKSLEIKPDLAAAFHNLATALQQLGRFVEAMDAFGRAIELDPNRADTRVNRAGLMLLTGDFVHGWPEFEWRWQTSQMRELVGGVGRWRGESLAGKTILLVTEQGFGDTFQFVRYAAEVKRLGATVMLACERVLKNLLGLCAGVDRVIAFGEELPPCDFQAPLMSLPGILQTRLETIPAEVPYLAADAKLTEQWRRRLPAASGFRIGIHWHGRGGVGNHRRRDIPLDLLTTLADIPGVRLINLQKGASEEAVAKLGDRVTIVDCDAELDTQSGAFMDTAAIMKTLDLVITSDTSIPHLAGALNVPVWLLVPWLPDWRWFLDRNDSPWYPSMRVFRQTKCGDWQGVMNEVRVELLRQIGRM